MDKNEVLKILETAKDKNGEVPMRLVRQAFEKLPEPCEDMISRQAAIDLFPNDALEWDTKGAYIAPHLARRMIEELPSAQPQRMRGRWIEIQAPDSDGNGLYECSVCHRGEVHVPIVEVPFCWHCGADMREGEK